MEITIALEHLDKALEDIEAYKKQFEEHVNETVKQLTELGRADAQINFSTARYDGDNDVEVVSQANKKTGTITASGKSTLFIEFGTGISYPNDHPEATRLGVEHGSWSEGPEGKGHWDDPNGWYYKHGKKSKGNPANRCLYNAGKKIEENAEKIAREIFK